jgi:hypothetical protein
MGLVLDELRDGDTNYDIDEVPVVVDPFALKVIKDSGGVTIRSSLFGPMAELNASAGTGCNC